VFKLSFEHFECIPQIEVEIASGADPHLIWEKLSLDVPTMLVIDEGRVESRSLGLEFSVTELI
jgi:hypothetical protein